MFKPSVGLVQDHDVKSQYFDCIAESDSSNYTIKSDKTAVIN